jgi:ABC-type transporter Mla subunit MlaD
MNLQEIPQDSVEISEELFPESTFQTISENLHQNLEEIVDRDLKTWNRGVTQGVVNGNEQLLNTIIQIKENIPMGINMVKKRVGELIEESLESFKGTIYRHIGELKNTDELVDNVNHIFQETNDKIGKILIDKLSENSEKRNEEIRTIDDYSETLEKNISTFNNKSKEINTLIDSTREGIKEETEKFDEKLKEKIKEANTDKFNSLEEMQKGISDIREKQLQKIQDKLEKLKKVSDKIKEI